MNNQEKLNDVKADCACGSCSYKLGEHYYDKQGNVIHSQADVSDGDIAAMEDEARDMNQEDIERSAEKNKYQ